MDLSWGTKCANFKETKHEDINGTKWNRDPLTGVWIDERRKSVEYQAHNPLVMQIARQTPRRFRVERVEDRPGFQKICSAPSLNFRRDNDTWALASQHNFSNTFALRNGLKSAGNMTSSKNIKGHSFYNSPTASKLGLSRHPSSPTLAARAMLNSQPASMPKIRTVPTPGLVRHPNKRLSAHPFRPRPPPKVITEEEWDDVSMMEIAGSTTLDLNNVNSMFADKVLWLPRK